MVRLRNTTNHIFHFGANYETFERAQELRKEMTEAEHIMWKRLKNKQLNGFKFRRQHPINKFIVDFYCHEKRLVIEIDGGIHKKPEIKERDYNRESVLKEFGLHILRFKNEEVINHLEKVLKDISGFLEGR